MRKPLYFCLMAAALAANAHAAKPLPTPKSLPDTSAKQVPFCGIHLIPPAQRQPIPLRKAPGTVFVETEPNSTVATAETIPLSSGSATPLLLQGEVTGATVTDFTTKAEDNGSITLATDSGLRPNQPRFVRTFSQISNTPATGDFDHFSLQANAGQVISARTRTGSDSNLDTALVLWSSTGELLVQNDDFNGTDSYIEYTVPTNGTYYLSVEAFGSIQGDPFNSTSGSGATSTGPYELILGLEAVTSFSTRAEDNGSITLATDTGIRPNTLGRFSTQSNIANSPSTGDFDFFAFQANAGQRIEISTITPTTSNLDTVLTLFDSMGTVLADNDDFRGTDSFIATSIPANGTYYARVRAFGSSQSNPFNSGSGSGIASTGSYTLTLNLSEVDLDHFRFTAERGDLLTLGAVGSLEGIAILGPAGELRLISSGPTNSFFEFPFQTPVITEGSISLTTILEEPGTYYLRVDGGPLTSDYDVLVSLAKPGLTAQPVGTRQILFLDFDGVTGLDTRIFGGSNTNATLSPLTTFLPRWGLTSADENAVIDAIIGVVQDRLVTRLVNSGLNPNFGLEIRNSRDHADPWGQPNVSRIIIGGTIAESGIETIGIAESIDTGNFNTQETALVLLDILSAPANDSDASVNAYPVGPAFTKIQAVGRAVGLVVAHEAGHYFGCWHTDNDNPTAEIMDQGGNAAQLFGVGPDRIWGTADDFQTIFNIDTFHPNERAYTGQQNTRAIVTFGLTAGTAPDSETTGWMIH